MVICGAGGMGSRHARNLKHWVQKAELVGVFDIDRKKATRLGKELRVPYWTDASFIDKLRDLDAVVISTPISAHLDNIKDFCEQGLGIFIEKPMGKDLDQDKAITDIVKKKSLKLQVGFQRRFDKSYLQANRYLRSGSIGKPLIVEMIAREPLSGEATDLGELFEGAIFRDNLIHEFDLVNWFFGFPPAHVCSSAEAFVLDSCRKARDFDNALVNLAFEDGPLINIDTTRISSYGYDLRAEIFGTRGLIRIDEQFEHNTALLVNRNTIRPPKPWYEGRFKDAYISELQAFAKCLLNDEKPTPNEDDGLKAGQLVDMALKSANNRTSVDYSN
jgi:predicted dehydrogenase